MRAHRYRLPLAILVAASAAVGATLLLRPRGRVVPPAAASATDYFTPDQLKKARNYRAPQRALMLASLALDGSLVVLAVARPPRAVRHALERAGTRPLAGPAAAGAAATV